MNSAVIIAIIVFVVLLLLFVVKKTKIFKHVKNDENKDYKVPLSDDIQHIYYDAYEKEKQKVDQSQEESKSSDSQHSEEES